MHPIYLDHNAATLTHPEVVASMVRYYAEISANPASQHRPGQQARQTLEDARERMAQILGADLSAPQRDRLIFTSGGTEANNLAILGIARAMANISPHPPAGEGQGVRDDASTQPVAGSPAAVPGQIIISSAEHQSVIEPAEHLLDHGWRMDTLGLTPQGVVRSDQLASLLENRSEHLPTLASIHLGNHETGVLQPVAQMAALCNKAGVPLHTDATQVVGKLPVSFHGLGVAAMTLTAHKFQGPLGIGALIVRDGVPILPLMFGGHQQSGLRPGTEPVALAVGMATALELGQKEQERHAQRLGGLRDRFEAGLRAQMPNIVVHGLSAERLPQTSNMAFPGLDGQVLLMALDLGGVACSVGSACSSGSTELSPTLRAMDLSNELVSSSLRFSVGSTTTEAEIDESIRRIVHVCRELHA